MFLVNYISYYFISSDRFGGIGGEFMRLSITLVNNKIVRKLVIFSIVFILFFSCFSFFYVEKIRAVPTILVDNPEFDSTIYDKTPIIKISYSDIVGINLDSVVFYLDNVDLTNSATVTLDSVIYIPPSNLTIGRHTILLTVSDTLNNSTVKSGAFNIANSISSIEEDVGDINPYDGKEINITDETTLPIVIYKIIINSKNKLNNTNLFIANLSVNSVGVSKPLITDTDIISVGAGYSITYTNNLFIHSYFNLEFLSNGSSIDESDIDSITIKFKILRSWIDSNNIDKQGVRLLRYTDNGWQELTTIFDSQDSNYDYYSAETKGFSLFALVGPEKLVDKPLVEGGGINILLIIGVIIAIIVIIIAFLFWKGYLYIER